LVATAIKHLNVYYHLLNTGMTIETTGSGGMWDIVYPTSAICVPAAATCPPRQSRIAAGN